MPSRIDTVYLRSLIKEKGFPSVASFGRHVGLSQSTMDRILDEKKPHNYNSQTLEIIANGLGVSTFELYKKEAIDEGLAVASAEAVAEVVVGAVSEAVTVVINDVAPDVPPQEVAKALPNEIPVVTPPAIDIPLYFDYIRKTYESSIEELKGVYTERIRTQNRIILGLFSVTAVLIATIVYLLVK